MGEFYEMFFEDAAVASRVLGITLTKRGKHQGAAIPMAGVPVHAKDSYIGRLVRAGLRIVVCDQIEVRRSTAAWLRGRESDGCVCPRCRSPRTRRASAVLLRW
jgi:DNA mismatch repair protein MutS